MIKSEDSLKVSIVTPSYNQGHFIEKTILSVLGQDYPNLEYVVLDSCSKDNTRKILDRYRNYIDVLVVEKDKGQSDALNRGFNLCSGDIFAYLNSDDCYADETVLSTVVKYFAAHPEVDVICGQRYYIDEKGYFRFCYPTRPFSEESLYLSCYIHQECTFWRRSIYEKAGGLIDDTFQFAMDYELWLRLLKAGAKFLAIEDVLGLFRHYDNQKSVAQWATFGLPEIERIYKLYCDQLIPEHEMINAYQEYFYGVNPAHDAELYRFSYDLWNTLVTCKQKMLTYPIDTWSVAPTLTQRKRLSSRSVSIQRE